MEERDQNYSSWFIGLFVITVLIVFHSLRKHRTVERLMRKRSQVMKKQEIDKNIIIVAVQILNFVVVYSKSYRSYYKPIEFGRQNFFESFSNFIKNKWPCYREKFQKKSIQRFFKDLKAIKNIKLYLCTRLEKNVCDKLLEKLHIQDCFQKKDRVYTSGRFISAEEIDHDTGRVIIISTNKQDQDRSVTNHHNVILDLLQDEKERFDESILSDLKECLIKLASNGRVDTLHEDMQNLLFQKGIPIYDDEM